MRLKSKSSGECNRWNFMTPEVEDAPCDGMDRVHGALIIVRGAYARIFPPRHPRKTRCEAVSAMFPTNVDVAIFA